VRTNCGLRASRATALEAYRPVSLDFGIWSLEFLPEPKLETPNLELESVTLLL
jgi:hypothetical protein